jgi:hypothetical protein
MHFSCVAISGCETLGQRVKDKEDLLAAAGFSWLGLGCVGTQRLLRESPRCRRGPSEGSIRALLRPASCSWAENRYVRQMLVAIERAVSRAISDVQGYDTGGVDDSYVTVHPGVTPINSGDCAGNKSIRCPVNKARSKP